MIAASRVGISSVISVKPPYFCEEIGSEYLILLVSNLRKLLAKEIELLVDVCHG